MSDWMEGVSGSVSEDSLETLSRLVEVLDMTVSEETRISAELKKVQETRRMLEEEQIPNLLNQYGLSEVKLSDGRKVIVAEFLRARIPAGGEARSAVLEFIENHGGKGIIKEAVVIDDPTPALVEALIDRGDHFTRSENVNTNSFQALLRELLGLKKGFSRVIDPSEVPAEAGLFIGFKTTIQG